jgi:alkylation response protein AidB-like acyl-CoA dehydrogenase
MQFSFSEDQRLFADGLRELLDRECTPAHVRAVWDDGSGHDAPLWTRLDEMGVLGILVPEVDGGFGGTEVDAVLLWQELGRACVPGPVLEHIVASPWLKKALGDSGGVSTLWLDSPYVPHVQVATSVLTGDSVLTGGEVTVVESIDGGRRLGTWSGFESTPIAGLDQRLVFDRAALASAAYLIGLSERMIEITGEYARQREQFGKPIGSFQAVKHLMSDALLKVEFAKPATYRAAWSCATDQPTRARDVSMAKAFASEAAYQASRSCMQVHGGIGYTWEADLQLFMKKAWALMRAYGDASFHRRRVAAAVLG